MTKKSPPRQIVNPKRNATRYIFQKVRVSVLNAPDFPR